VPGYLFRERGDAFLNLVELDNQVKQQPCDPDYRENKQNGQHLSLHGDMVTDKKYNAEAGL
jgi:hypothetical protein